MDKFKQYAYVSLGISLGSLLSLLIFVIAMGKEISTWAVITVTIIVDIGLWPILFEKRLKQK